MSTGFSFADLQKVADDAGFKLVPDGEYEAQVDVNAKAAKSGNGKDMIKIAWKILEGPQAGKGRVFHNFVISPDSPAALGFFFRHMAVLGLEREFFASNPSMETVAKALEGKRAKITVGHREWNGTDRNEVTKIVKSTGSPATPTINGNAGAGVPSIGTPAVSTPQVTPPAQPAATPQVPVTTPAVTPEATQAATSADVAGAPDDPF